MQRIQIHPASGALPSCKHSSIFRPLGTLCPLTPFWLQRGGLNAVFTGLRGRAQQHAELQSHGPWALIWRRTNRHETAYGADTCVNILWQHTELTSLQFGWPRLATCGVAITRPSVPHTERTNRHETAYRADACANILMKARQAAYGADRPQIGWPCTATFEVALKTQDSRTCESNLRRLLS